MKTAYPTCLTTARVLVASASALALVSTAAAAPRAQNKDATPNPAAASLTAPAGGWLPPLIDCGWVARHEVVVLDGQTLGWRGGSVQGIDALTPQEVVASGNRDLGAAMANRLPTDSLHFCTANQALKEAVAAAGATVRAPQGMKWRDASRFKSIEHEERRAQLQEAVNELATELARPRLLLELEATIEASEGGIDLRVHKPALKFVNIPSPATPRPILCSATPLGRATAWIASEPRNAAFCLAVRNWIVDNSQSTDDGAKLRVPAAPADRELLLSLPARDRKIWLRFISIRAPEIYSGDSGAGAAASTVLREIGDVLELFITVDEKDGARVIFNRRFRHGRDVQLLEPRKRDLALDSRLAAIEASAPDAPLTLRLAPAAPAQVSAGEPIQVRLSTDNASPAAPAAKTDEGASARKRAQAHHTGASP